MCDRRASVGSQDHYDVSCTAPPARSSSSSSSAATETHDPPDGALATFRARPGRPRAGRCRHRGGDRPEDAAGRHHVVADLQAGEERPVLAQASLLLTHQQDQDDERKQEEEKAHEGEESSIRDRPRLARGPILPGSPRRTSVVTTTSGVTTTPGPTSPARPPAGRRTCRRARSGAGAQRRRRSRLWIVSRRRRRAHPPGADGAGSCATSARTPHTCRSGRAARRRAGTPRPQVEALAVVSTVPWRASRVGSTQSKRSTPRPTASARPTGSPTS